MLAKVFSRAARGLGGGLTAVMVKFFDTVVAHHAMVCAEGSGKKRRGIGSGGGGRGGLQRLKDIKENRKRTLVPQMGLWRY